MYVCMYVRVVVVWVSYLTVLVLSARSSVILLRSADCDEDDEGDDEEVVT